MKEYSTIFRSPELAYTGHTFLGWEVMLLGSHGILSPTNIVTIWFNMVNGPVQPGGS